jgi:hypothetical protein
LDYLKINLILGSLIPHTDDCTKFYFCINGMFVELPCDQGYIFPPGQNLDACIPGTPDEC